MLIEVLQKIYEEDSFMFPVDILDKESLNQSYQCFKTFRKTSDTRSLEHKASSSDIDVVNRWRSLEQVKIKRQSIQIN